jgi:hypothetical protein
MQRNYYVGKTGMWYYLQRKFRKGMLIYIFDYQFIVHLVEQASLGRGERKTRRTRAQDEEKNERERKEEQEKREAERKGKG